MPEAGSIQSSTPTSLQRDYKRKPSTEFLTVVEVMRFLGISDALARKVLPQVGFVTLGRRILVRRPALEAYIARQTTPPQAVQDREATPVAAIAPPARPAKAAPASGRGRSRPRKHPLKS